MKNIFQRNLFLIILLLLTILFLTGVKTVFAYYYEKSSDSLISGVVGNLED